MITPKLIFEPGQIGKLKVSNRIVMPAASTYCATLEGYVTDKIINLYVERAKGGVGLIVTQGAYILYETPGSVHHLGLCDDSFIPGLRTLAEQVHTVGTPIMLSLSHIGAGQMEPVRKAAWKRELDSVGPSAVPFANTGLIPREMTLKDIEHVENAYADATKRAQDAGFDGVEIHACHGRLISMFLSPFYNKRTDGYGGDRQKRARFACEIIEHIKQKVGADFPVIMKINGDDLHEGGARSEDSVVTAQLLEKAGVDAICVSAGSFGLAAPIPTYMDKTGVWVPFAAAIKKVVKIPVITVGNLDIEYGERVLKEKKADFIGMCRPLFADPYLPNKAKEGKWDEINNCIRCNNCMTTISRHDKPPGDGIRCTVNPGLCREAEFQLKPTESPRKIMVVGGGLAGMQAACDLAERGHKVSIYERDSKLGGQFNIASLQSDKKDLFPKFINYLTRRLNKTGVKVKHNKEMTPQDIKNEKPDVVVVATGGMPIVLDVPGVNGKNVVQATDVILGKAKVGNNVVVIGGRLRGLEMANTLVEQGKRVALVTKNMIGENGIPLEHMTFWTVRRKLIDQGVRLFPNAPVREINDEGVYIYYQGGLIFLKADTIVLAVGARSDDKLKKQLEGDSSITFYSIGDCARCVDAMQATQDGAELARTI